MAMKSDYAPDVPLKQKWEDREHGNQRNLSFIFFICKKHELMEDAALFRELDNKQVLEYFMYAHRN